MIEEKKKEREGRKKRRNHEIWEFMECRHEKGVSGGNGVLDPNEDTDRHADRHENVLSNP